MNHLARAVCALILTFAALVPAAAKTILVVAPHPDDEALIAAGTVAAAVAAGHTVKIVVVTNGDFAGVENGLARQGESVASAQLLGLTEQDVIFLGYPDGALMTIYNAPSPSDIITSNAGQTQTYGTRGMGGMDYHRLRFGSPGAYNRVTMEQDVRALLEEFRPDEIYTVSHFDTHPDHHATGILVTEALAALKRSGAALATKLHQGIVWVPGQEGVWPNTGAGTCSPDTPFPAPQMATQLEWKRTLRATVLGNLKCQAIQAFASQANPHLLSFARKDEGFWVSDFGANLALTAQVTASSESVTQGRMRAVDGIVSGAHHDAAREWVSASQLGGAWIQLDWPAAVSVSQVNLYDRPQGGENVLAGTLSFSDGTSIAVAELPGDGKLLPVTFAPKSVTWVRFTIDQAEGAASGLSEIEVLGLQSDANVTPHFIEGPGGATDQAILSAETATFSVRAHDLNGDALQIQWQADGGNLAANGASAVFTPPAVSASTVFTITATLLDGRGGSASNVGFVTVAPSVDAVTLTPASVFGGNSAQGTITLAAAAPGGGLSVPLSSSHPSVASVPPSVTIPAGSASATFPVSTTAVGARVDATITATINGTPRSAALVVTPQPSPVPSENLLLSPDRIGDGNWHNLGPIRSTLGAAAAPDGTQNASRVETTAQGGHALAQVVNVAGNASYAFSFYARNNGGSAASYSVHCSSLGTDIIPATPYVAGINASGWTQVSATFTTPASCNQIVVYPVRDSGTPVDVLLWRATLVPANVTPPLTLASLTVNPATVTGGGTATGTATLSAAAPAGGAEVSLSSNNPSVTVPASVTVAAGATSATFSVTTSPVATPTSVTLTGTLGGASQTASLSVTPAVLSSLSTSPASVTGGSAVSGTVTLSGPAPAGGAQVALSSSSGAVSVPASVTVPAGAASASFSATTSPVAAATTATISASYGGATQTSALTVVPPRASALSLSQGSVTGGTSVTGTVMIDGPAPAGGAVVQLSANSAAASVPGSVTIAAGGTSATFAVATSPVAASTAVSISASSGGATVNVSLTVLPPVISALSVSPASVTGGTAVTGTVTLNGPAPVGGAQVALSDNSGATSLPASVTVAAGATSATFSIGTSAVADNTAVTISASYGGATRTASLTVLPAVLSSLALNPTQVVGGLQGSTGTVTLNGPAPAGGAVVALSSSSGAASVPGSVTIPAGATSATFIVNTAIVVVATNVTITGSYKGTTRSANLRVTNALGL
jgi:LmbE family N-acetylglucosaminyl deacetylase